MYCSNCGAQIQQGANVCVKCGVRVAKASNAQPVARDPQSYRSQPVYKPSQPVNRQPAAPQQTYRSQPVYKPAGSGAAPAQQRSQPVQQPVNRAQPQPQPINPVPVQPVSAATKEIAIQEQKNIPVPAPGIKLKTNRSLLKFILLGLITFGIYDIVVLSSISTDINIIASRHDDRKTMHFCLVYFVFSWLTLGIVPLIWGHNLSERIAVELSRRGISYSFGVGTYWGWWFFGSLILVGPFIYCHKLLKSMNYLCESYNAIG